MQLSALEQAAARILINLALEEDLGTLGDLTANSVMPENARGSALIVARQTGVVSGLPLVNMIAAQLDITPGMAIDREAKPVTPGTVVASYSGPMRKLLAFERTALNFLQRLSGIASLTARYVAETAGTKAGIYDTRKTTPGWRLLEKYAVRCGGGRNHRIGLYDAVLIKDNHLAWLTHEGDPIGKAVKSARELSPQGTIIEVEVDTWDQYERALACALDIILLDNFGVPEIRKAVAHRDQVSPNIQLETSGGITLETVRARAETGVDRISVGALTHSAPALDFGLDFDQVLP